MDADVVTQSEYANLRNAVDGFNTFIQAQAQARGMAYVDVNAALLAAVGNGTIPPFPDLRAALAGGNVGFGPLFSLDGVHPSTLAHQLVADSVAAGINRTFNAAAGNNGIPVPVCGAITCPN